MAKYMVYIYNECFRKMYSQTAYRYFCDRDFDSYFLNHEKCMIFENANENLWNTMGKIEQRDALIFFDKKYFI